MAGCTLVVLHVGRIVSQNGTETFVESSVSQNEAETFVGNIFDPKEVLISE